MGNRNTEKKSGDVKKTLCKESRTSCSVVTHGVTWRGTTAPWPLVSRWSLGVILKCHYHEGKQGNKNSWHSRERYPVYYLFYLFYSYLVHNNRFAQVDKGWRIKDSGSINLNHRFSIEYGLLSLDSAPLTTRAGRGNEVADAGLAAMEKLKCVFGGRSGRGPGGGSRGAAARGDPGSSISSSDTSWQEETMEDIHK